MKDATEAEATQKPSGDLIDLILDRVDGPAIIGGLYEFHTSFKVSPNIARAWREQ